MERELVEINTLYGVSIPQINEGNFEGLEKEIYVYIHRLFEEDVYFVSDYFMTEIVDFNGNKIKKRKIEGNIIYLDLTKEDEKKYLINPMKVFDEGVEKGDVVCFKNEEFAKLFKVRFVKEMINEYEKKLKSAKNVGEIRDKFKEYEKMESQFLHRII